MVFLDTNILVYRFDADSPEKQAIARDEFNRLVTAGDAVISTQVLQEFFVVVTRRFARALPEDQALRALAALARLPLVAQTGALVLRAAQACGTRRLSFWDSMIVEAALEAGADTLLTEDLQDGAVIEGVRVRNPFAA